MNIRQPKRIVLIPRPFSPLQGFAYYILTRVVDGEMSLLGDHYIRWATVKDYRDDAGKDLPANMGTVVNLAIPEQRLREMLDRVIVPNVKLSCTSHHFWRLKFKNFFSYLGNYPAALKRWRGYTGILSRHASAKPALQCFCGFVDNLFGRTKLPESVEGKEFSGLIRSPFQQHPLLPGTMHVTVPVTKRVQRPDEDHAREIVRHTTKELPQREIFHLCGEKVVILVGGDPGLGKSTFAAALAVEMINIIKTLQSLGKTWGTLTINPTVFSLDTATPVPKELLMSGEAGVREKLEALKRPWSIPLVWETLQRLEELLDDRNCNSWDRVGLVVADLPGQVTDITRLLAAHATFGIILHPTEKERWAASNERWVTYFKEIGVPVVATIKSTLTGESMLSELRTDEIFGRLRRPRRLITGADSFILACAKFLLFRVLAVQLSKLHDRIEAQAREGVLYGLEK